MGRSGFEGCFTGSTAEEVEARCKLRDKGINEDLVIVDRRAVPRGSEEHKKKLVRDAYYREQKKRRHLTGPIELDCTGLSV